MRSILLVVHVLAWCLVALVLFGYVRNRQSEVAALRQTAEQERAERRRLEERVQIMNARLDGLRGNDPYMVELVARERLGWKALGAFEVLPPAQGVDSNDLSLASQPPQ
jgi:cell division protein FtsB